MIENLPIYSFLCALASTIAWRVAGSPSVGDYASAFLCYILDDAWSLHVYPPLKIQEYSILSIRKNGLMPGLTYNDGIDLTLVILYFYPVRHTSGIELSSDHD